MAQKGNAAFRYDPGTGQVTVDLDWPLINPEPARRRTRFASDSLDFTAREVLEVGSGIHEITAELRFQESHADLLDALEEAASGTRLDYYPDTVGAPSTFYPCQLIEPSGSAIGLIRDRLRGISHGEFALPARIRLRRIDGGNFDGIL